MRGRISKTVFAARENKTGKVLLKAKREGIEDTRREGKVRGKIKKCVARNEKQRKEYN